MMTKFEEQHCARGQLQAGMCVKLPLKPKYTAGDEADGAVSLSLFFLRNDAYSR